MVSRVIGSIRPMDEAKPWPRWRAVARIGDRLGRRQKIFESLVAISFAIHKTTLDRAASNHQDWKSVSGRYRSVS